MSNYLSDFVTVNRRYTRSVNLERDLFIAESVNGYIPTPCAVDVLNRIFESMIKPRSVRAWTLTGVYGCGKSSFAHFLCSLVAPDDEPIKINANKILNKSQGIKKAILKTFKKELQYEKGFVRCVVTSQIEPISYTIIKALRFGAVNYWQGSIKTHSISKQIEELYKKITLKGKIDNDDILNIIQQLSLASRSGVLIVVDELGKNLEYVASKQTNEDLYLLQQIAELPSGKSDPPVFFIGLLHQSFSDYAHRLTIEQRKEWGKIQGRFEDIPFAEQPEVLLNLIGKAINKSKLSPMQSEIDDWSHQWNKALSGDSVLSETKIHSSNISQVFPIHPIAAYVLPSLCNRYGQNDRSLFTFLASEEPYSFKRFISKTSFLNGHTPTLKLDVMYNYFLESAGMAFSGRQDFQRWSEIQGRISDAMNLNTESLKALKSVGILNLTSLSGVLRAKRKTVLLSLMDKPNSQKEKKKWQNTLDSLVQKGFLTWRKYTDEFRIWEGTDFDIEQQIANQTDINNQSLLELLTEYCPLEPLVVHRHSFETGTLRYFERSYANEATEISSKECNDKTSDGLILYLLKTVNNLRNLPKYTQDEKPLVIIPVGNIEHIHTACKEYAALRNIQKKCPELQIDKVASSEVRHRIRHAKDILDDMLQSTFQANNKPTKCWILGKLQPVKRDETLNTILSKLCDDVYKKGPILWNELINKRQLSSQGVKARRDLLHAMIDNTTHEKLGIKGYGPERTMYESLLYNSGIHRRVGEDWVFEKPETESGLFSIWSAINDFCSSSRQSPKNIQELYETLNSPPYGMKEGAVPVLLLSVLLYRSDDLGLYQDGTYQPILSITHFELLVKSPSRFSIKCFDFQGLRREVFSELEKVIQISTKSPKNKIRNIPLLSVVKPLVSFIKNLPDYTKQTLRLSEHAISVRNALLKSIEPDELLFTELPKACNLQPINASEKSNKDRVKEYINKLIKIIRELQISYEKILSECSDLLLQAFSISGEKQELRKELRLRAQTLLNHCVETRLKSFVIAAVDEKKDYTPWLEAMIMIISEKPADKWKDEDYIQFELKLADLSQRFKNLERLINQTSKISTKHSEARRISITHQDGQEYEKIIWVNKKDNKKVKELVKKVLDSEVLQNNIMKETFFTLLAEEILKKP